MKKKKPALHTPPPEMAQAEEFRRGLWFREEQEKARQQADRDRCTAFPAHPKPSGVRVVAWAMGVPYEERTNRRVAEVCARQLREMRRATELTQKTTRELLGRALIEAVRAGDENRVRSLIRQGADIGFIQNDGTGFESVTELAVRLNRVRMVRRMAETDASQVPKLAAHALSCDKPEILKELLHLGLCLDAPCLYVHPFGVMPPLVHAVATGNRELFRFLTEHGASCLRADADNILLRAAVLYGRHEMLRELLQRGLTPGKCKGKDSALNLACRCGDAEMVQLLIDHGADVNDKKHPPLVTACYGNRQDIVDMLVRCGARYVPHPEAETPVCRAMKEALRRQNPNLYRYLMQGGEV